MHTDFICIYCHKSLININKCCLQISNLYLCFIAISFLGLYTRLHHCSMNTAVNRYLLSTFWNHPCQILSKYVPAVSCSGAVNHEWSCSEWCSSAALQHKYEPLFRKQNLTVLHTIYNIYTLSTISTQPTHYLLSTTSPWRFVPAFLSAAIKIFVFAACITVQQIITIVTNKNIYIMYHTSIKCIRVL